MDRKHRILQPAPPKTTPLAVKQRKETCFYDLPAEIRIQIYKIVLENVTIHIVPTKTDARATRPHALTRTSKQVRNEVLPIIHENCSIRAVVTDFNFTGLLAFVNRIPPDDHRFLVRNQHLSIRLCTTLAPPGNLETLRRWLHYRADRCRPQPNWRYTGPHPSSKVANDLKRRWKRMTEQRKKKELERMVRAIGVNLNPLHNIEGD